MRARPTLLPTALLAVVLAPAAAPADAQVRACTTADGGTVYTDRGCAALGATERVMATPGVAGSPVARASGCARRLRDLVDGVTMAIESSDTAGLVALYHWPGLGHDAGYRLVERLDAIARRPLLRVTALRPPAVAQVTATTGWTDSTVPPETPLKLPVPSPRAPVALRIDQVQADGYTPVRTVFGLRRNLECWWISL
jgi:hypothetical protein